MSIVTISVPIACPHCKTETSSLVECLFYEKPMVVTCDVEEGGCGRYFIAYPHYEVHVRTAKIEGA